MAKKQFRLSPEERQTIKDLFDAGVSKAEIVRQTGRSIFIVKKVVSGESKTRAEQKQEWRCKDCGTRFQGGYRLYCYGCARGKQAAKRNRTRAVEIHRRQKIFDAKLELTRFILDSYTPKDKEGHGGSDAASQG